jgi:TRAP-type C4-dicarboxylate transport system permease small subunit
MGVSALLAGLGWGAWDWASDTGHDTIGLVAGVLMVPAAVAFAAFLVITLIALVPVASRRATEQRRTRMDAVPVAPVAPVSLPPLDAVDSPAHAKSPRERVAA